MANSTDDLEEALKSLPNNFKMRDIFDFCTRHGLNNLAQGMIELAPPPKMRERASNLCLHNEVVHQYRNRFGEDEYRVAVQHFLERHYKIKVPYESILATSGVSGAIFSTLMTLKHERGQLRVSLLVPFYTYHQKQVTEVFGVEPGYIEPNPDLSPNFENIEAALKKGVDVIIFCNPGNPQGNVWTQEQILKMVHLTAQHNCIIIIDEIYCDLVWRGNLFSPINEKVFDNVVVCRGFAKTLAAQSWRVAYMIAAPAFTARIMRTHDPIYISVPFLQHAIAQYLEQDYSDFTEYLKKISELMTGNWKILSKALEKKFGWEPIEPDGSMYGMFRHKSKTDKDAVLLGLKQGVGVAPGNIFFPGMPENTGYVRIHCGISSAKAHTIVKLLES